MKNTKNLKQENNMLFKILLIVLTSLFVIATLLFLFKPFEIKKIDRIHEINIDEYNTMLEANDDHDHEDSHEYLIFVYNSNTSDQYNVSQNEEVERYILEYANYARKNHKASKIYVLDISKSENSTAVSTLGLKDENIPSLIVMKNDHSANKISERHKTIQAIQNYLSELMK